MPLPTRLNAADWGCSGKGVTYHAPIEAKVTDQAADIKALSADIEAGKVSLLADPGRQPTLRCALPMRTSRKAYLSEKCPLRAFISPTMKTRLRSFLTGSLPESHGLESWGDLKAHDGTVGLQQPLVEPLYATKTPTEVICALLLGQPLTGMELLRQHHATIARAESGARQCMMVYSLERGKPSDCRGGQPVASLLAEPLCRRLTGIPRSGSKLPPRSDDLGRAVC